ncbi:hypothetical protein [Castellaniella denitrificans]|jgi:hypothetical protein|uniref:hypothetical protein n=1 Tax=Castellaniella denitrificans TaxID=56119 RepID=UPI003622CC97
MTTIIDFADALADGLRAKLADVPTVSADPPPRQKRSLKLPAVYLDIDDIEPMQEAGDSRLLADVRWNAYCLFDPNQARADLLLRAFAARVAVALHEIRRPVPGHGHIRLSRAGDDAFRPALDGYLCWVVEFNIEIALGELEAPGVTPSEIHIGQSPAIGEHHADDYERIA